MAMKAAISKGLFKGVNIPNCDQILSHLFYADDALFMGEWSKENSKNLARILRCFHISSGLKVNFSKSQVFGIGADMAETTEWAGILGCVAGSLPFQYLGAPVGANMNLKKNWQPIIDRFHSKLSLWKAKTLSFGVVSPLSNPSWEIFRITFFPSSKPLSESLINWRAFEEGFYRAVTMSRRKFIGWHGIKWWLRRRKVV